MQRAKGSARILLSGSGRGTRVVDVFERSPLRVMFPRVGAEVEEIVLINTSGGIAGGDKLGVQVTALIGASITVTTQAAEKVYRALSQPARITTNLRVAHAAKLAWLPQETILFNGGRLTRKMEIDVSSGAEVLALEWLVLGRALNGEKVIWGHITDSWRVRKDGRLIWADSFRITDSAFPNIHRNALLGNCMAIATLIYYGPDLESSLGHFRDILPSSGYYSGATLIGGLIIIRFAAGSAFDLRCALRAFLENVSLESWPGPFRVPKMWSC
jgi:urease accessory protein